MNPMQLLIREISPKGAKGGAKVGQGNQMLGDAFQGGAPQSWCGNGAGTPPRTTQLPMGSNVIGFGGGVGIAAGATVTYEVKPSCGAFVLERLVAPSIFADPFFLVDLKVGPTSQIQVATTTLAPAGSFIGISFRQMSELGVNIFQQALTLTSVCPAIITIVNTSAAAQSYSLSGVGYYLQCT